VRRAGEVAAALLAAMPLVAMPLIAQPRPAMNAVKHAQATVQAVSIGASSATLLVTLAVDDGWHVSWRNPGETGLPTRFVWNLPAGVRAGRETWPVPVITRSDVGVAHTLEGTVPWLVEFTLDAPSAADRLVSLTLRYGICRDVCIPEQLTVQGVLPGSAAGASPLAAVPPALRARLAVDAAPVPARLNATTGLCLDRLPTGITGRGLEMIAGPDRDLDGAMRIGPSTKAARGPVRVRLPAGARLRQPADTVLLVAGDRGVTLPLDFRAPAPRCR
jgi:DsbC/DsbD-like thiol-disulfide interchange protein